MWHLPCYILHELLERLSKITHPSQSRIIIHDLFSPLCVLIPPCRILRLRIHFGFTSSLLLFLPLVLHQISNNEGRRLVKVILNYLLIGRLKSLNVRWRSCSDAWLPIDGKRLCSRVRWDEGEIGVNVEKQRPYCCHCSILLDIFEWYRIHWGNLLAHVLTPNYIPWLDWYHYMRRILVPPTLPSCNWTYETTHIIPNYSHDMIVILNWPNSSTRIQVRAICVHSRVYNVVGPTEAYYHIHYGSWP